MLLPEAASDAGRRVSGVFTGADGDAGHRDARCCGRSRQDDYGVLPSWSDFPGSKWKAA